MSNALLEKKLYLAKQTPEPVFDISDCDIKRIPNKIFSVIKVLRKESLYLQNNKLASLKEGGSLQDLCLIKLLDLSSNKIDKLPVDIQHLKNLQILRLDHNELTSLPKEIAGLFCLEQLTLSSNKLKSLPDTIGDLRNLQLLDLRRNNHLRTLPNTICKNRKLQSLLLDESREWIEPPTSVIRKSTPAVLKYFAEKSGSFEIEEDEIIKSENVLPLESVQQLSIYDKYIQDNLRRLEKEKEENLLKKIEMEKNFSDQKERELRLCQQNQCEKQKLMDSLTMELQRMDKKILKCQKRREEEQSNFIQQLQSVENKADKVIKQLLKTIEVQKQENISSIVSSLIEDISIEQNILHQRKVLECMEKLLAEEYVLSLKLQENDAARNNLIHISNLNNKQVENKIADLLCERRKEQNSLIDGILKDSSLQYAAVLLLIDESDYRNIELHNQISVIQTQLSNLTALELQNRNLLVSQNINELEERRLILTDLLQDVFAQQQSRRKLLIDQLRIVENFQSSVFQNKDDYWMIQFQKLLYKSGSDRASDFHTVDSFLINELALFGVSHYASLLSTFDLESIDSLSEITDNALEEIGITPAGDRSAVLNAIQRFINDRRPGITPTAPAQYLSDSLAAETVAIVSTVPSAPATDLLSDSQSIYSTNDTLPNECVICLDKQSTIVFISCGHLCCCSNCSSSVDQCPLCRCDIQSKMQIYTA